MKKRNHMLKLNNYVEATYQINIASPMRQRNLVHPKMGQCFVTIVHINKLRSSDLWACPIPEQSQCPYSLIKPLLSMIKSASWLLKGPDCSSLATSPSRTSSKAFPQEKPAMTGWKMLAIIYMPIMSHSCRDTCDTCDTCWLGNYAQ